MRKTLDEEPWLRDSVTDPTIAVFDVADELSEAAATQWAEVAIEAVHERGQFVVALSGGSTPLALYARLVESPYAEILPWASTHVFWGDERCVPPEHPQSNAGQAQRVLLDHVPIPAENIHRVRGELTAVEAAADYVRQLRAMTDSDPVRRVPAPDKGDRAWPRFDLVLLGLGVDGHTASIFPGPIAPEDPSAPAIPVTASYQGRPAQRVTLTAQVFNAARVVLFLVTGEDKAAALSAVLTGPEDLERWPAQRIRPAAGLAHWMADAAAARLLA
jgi:6-phosphogluconolactonase